MHAHTAAPQSRWAFLANLQVQTKILLGFATVLMILIVVGGSGLWSSMSASDRFAEYSRVVALVSAVGEMDIDFQRLRRRVLVYVTSEKQADYKAAEELVKEVKGKVDELVKKVIVPEQAVIMRGLSDTYAAFSKQFEEAATLSREIAKLRHDSLDVFGPKMVGELQEIAALAAAAGNSNAVVHAQTALQAVMEVRLYSTRALDEHDETMVGKAKESFARLSKSMNALEAASADASFQAIAKAVSAEDEKYFAVFEKAWEEELRVDTLVNKSMKDAADKIAADSTKLSEIFEKSEHAAQASAEETLAIAEIMAIVLSLGGLALGVGLAWLIGRAIASGIIATTHVMAQLADGDDSTDVAATDRKDEIGQMTRALIALRATVSDAFRLKQMVENMPNNIMLADGKNLVFTYANKTCLDTMRNLGNIFGVEADKMVGSGIDGLHKDLGQQRRVFADVKSLPYRARLKAGDETLQLNVAAVLDKKGAYIGPMLTWEIVTKQVRMATRVAEVVGVVSSAATEMQSTAQSMSATAEETSKQAAAVAAASEQAATNVQTVAAATEELSSSITEISRQVTQSSQIAAQAVADAENSNKQV